MKDIQQLFIKTQSSRKGLSHWQRALIKVMIICVIYTGVIIANYACFNHGWYGFRTLHAVMHGLDAVTFAMATFALVKPITKLHL